MRDLLCDEGDLPVGVVAHQRAQPSPGVVERVGGPDGHLQMPVGSQLDHPGALGRPVRIGGVTSKREFGEFMAMLSRLRAAGQRAEEEWTA
jgi:hypothetical protein